MGDPNTASQGVSLDSMAGWYDIFTLVPGERHLREKTIELAALRPGDRVLDVGCGTGRLALLMKAVVGDQGAVAGIDLAPRMIARARHQAQKRGLALDFQVASIADLPFPAGSFDVATSTLMVHHLPRPIKQAGFAEVRRVLRPGGRFVVGDFGPRSARLRPARGWRWIVRPLAHLFAAAGEDPADNLTWRIPALLEEAGFTAVETLAHVDLLAGLLRVHFVCARAPSDR